MVPVPKCVSSSDGGKVSGRLWRLQNGSAHAATQGFDIHASLLSGDLQAGAK
jgi:hypothetical protein